MIDLAFGPSFGTLRRQDTLSLCLEPANGLRPREAGHLARPFSLATPSIYFKPSRVRGFSFNLALPQVGLGIEMAICFPRNARPTVSFSSGSSLHLGVTDEREQNLAYRGQNLGWLTFLKLDAQT